MKALPEDFARISLTALPQEEIPQLLVALAGEAARGIRPRTPEAMAAVRSLLEGPYPPVPWAKEGAYLDADSTAGAHPLHAAGAYYLQEPSAMAAVSALDVQPGQRVLDLCAAPGGKSTQIAARLGGTGVLVANEIVSSRARILSQNVERLGVTNAIVTNEPPDTLAARWGAWFDRVLVDAPCSGEGMFRREPESRGEWTPKSPQGCAARQQQVLDAAAALVAPGGLMVYSTCTFNTYENEGVVASFLAEHPAFHAESFALEGIGVSENGCIRLWPHRVRGEGHFVARLRREGQARELEPPSVPPVMLHTLMPAFGTASIVGNLHTSGARVWVTPAESPSLSGIRVLRDGLAVGEWRGKTFVPDHAAAMAFAPDTFAQAVTVDDEQAARYLRGETLAAEGCEKGWLVIAYHGFCLGWAKCADDMLKNHLPKGLRRMK